MSLAVLSEIVIQIGYFF